MRKLFSVIFALFAFTISLAQNAQQSVPNPQLQLSNGVMMPQFGIGTFMMRDNEECYQIGRAHV